MAWGKLVWLATTVAGLGQYYGTDEHKVRLLRSTWDYDSRLQLYGRQEPSVPRTLANRTATAQEAVHGQEGGRRQQRLSGLPQFLRHQLFMLRRAWETQSGMQLYRGQEPCLPKDPRSDVQFWAEVYGTHQDAEEGTEFPDTDSESKTTSEEQSEGGFELTFTAAENRTGTTTSTETEVMPDGEEGGTTEEG